MGGGFRSIIKFVGVGEKVEALQPFYPDRMASRILGMGDVLTLVEKAQEEFDLSDAQKMQEKILRLSSTYRLLKQMRLLKNMGSLGGIIKMIPGMNKLSDDQLKQGETQLKRSEAMINSMTSEERRSCWQVRLVGDGGCCGAGYRRRMSPSW